MTDVIGKNIRGKCPKCGNEGKIDLYGSANMTVGPELLEKVKNRKINSFHCEKCGFKNEIIMPFLYHDMDDIDKNLMVWVYPEGEEGREMARASEKAQEEDKSQASQLLRAMQARLTRNVYGFDELFKLLEEHEK